jgi:hypothetical protein
MRGPDYPDCFIVVNGPEDGTEFPIVRAPFHIGCDPSCAVNIRLDDSVGELHALVTAVSDGYRVRRNDVGAVYVDGKRAGFFRSKIARAGSKIKVGQTLLCVECSPSGLASRSHGVVTQSDAAWALAQSARLTMLLLFGGLRFVTRVFGRILGSWLAIASLGFLLYLSWPTFHNYVNWGFYAIYYKILAAFQTV